MGSFLGKLFVDPTTLPGGDNCGGNSTIYNITQHSDPLHCSECMAMLPLVQVSACVHVPVPANITHQPNCLINLVFAGCADQLGLVLCRCCS